ATAAIVSAVCQANDHGFGGLGGFSALAFHSGFHEAYKLHSPTNSTTTPPFTFTNELIHDCNPINTETHHHQTHLPSNVATIVSHKVKGLAGP
nr:hypothetical protein [Tanacetum cinerariifolium]